MWSAGGEAVEGGWGTGAVQSENTVKTHASRLFDKLQARRRTQAVLRAREAGLIP